jgi:glycosyltransferase involved in cell wall biosynthesis
MLTIYRSLERFVGKIQRRRRSERIRRILPKAVPVSPPARGAVTVAGLLRAPTGIGEGARLGAGAFAELGYSVGLVDLTPQRQRDARILQPQGANLTPGDIGGPVIVHMNPPAMMDALYELRDGLTRRRVIGHWVWEIPVLPPQWHQSVEFLHEVWVPSRFVAAAVATTVRQVPIRIVPYAVRPSDPVAPMTIATGKTVYLTMFSYNSGFDRKNPVAAIAAFRRAFADRDDVTLIVKAQGAPLSHKASYRALMAAIAGAPNISVLDRDLTSLERDALIARADVLVSLHRSEGFGLPLAEALVLGKAVIATNWSGNTDFMTRDTSSLIDYKLVPMSTATAAYAGLKAHWADPDIDHASAEMLRLSDPSARTALGANAHRFARQAFTLEAFKAAVEPGLA